MNMKHTPLQPKEILPETFPPVCEDGRGPVGNGGLSLRSRKWMIKAIETCPHVTNSGLEIDDQPLACKVFEKVNEVCRHMIDSSVSLKLVSEELTTYNMSV